MVNDLKKFAGVRVLIFDLDGTLIDSKLDLALSINATLEYMRREPLPHEEIFGMVGNGAAVLVRRALSSRLGCEEVTDKEVERALGFFLSYYRTHMLDNTVAYPGVEHGLAMLERYPKAVLTNKPEKFSRAILEGLNLSPHFRYVYGGNSFEKKKPDPMGVYTLLRELDSGPREAMMVGDSEVDVLTARNGGIWACGVTYGLGTKGLLSNPPDLMLDNLTDLRSHLNGR